MPHIGTQILSTVLKNSTNINIIDSCIYENCDSNDDYIVILYDTVGEILKRGQTRETLYSIATDITQRRCKWNHPCFDKYNKDIEEEDHLDDEMEIEEGVLECHKCGSFRTISYQRQTRSADEGSTTFARCVQCSHSWRFNN